MRKRELGGATRCPMAWARVWREAVRDETARALLRVDGREAAGAAREEVGRGRGAREPTRRWLRKADLGEGGEVLAS